jgi:hypothetical protein
MLAGPSYGDEMDIDGKKVVKSGTMFEPKC